MTMKNINNLWNVALALCLFLTVNCKNDVMVSEVQVENNDETPETVESTEHVEPFIPTKEWQVIKPNQAIPKGLHVRINFQTGIKEAKILETDGIEDNASCPKKDKFSEDDGDSCNEKKGPLIVLGEEIKPTQNDDKIYFTKDQLKEALHEFRDKVGVNDVPDVTWSPDAKKALEEEQLEHEKQVKKKFRTIDEIKAELKDSLNLNIKSDVDVMKQLVRVVIADNSTAWEKVEALDHLEYYVHQVDNAIDLDKIGGLEPVVLLLNSTVREVQEKSAALVAAATQNNKEVKQRVLQYGGLRLLLQLVHPEKEVSTKKKAIFALSALTRDFPNAWNELISSNGVKGIIHIIKDSSSPSFLRVKAIDFFFGLLREQNTLEEGKVTTIGHMIEENDLCGMLVPLLKSGDFSHKEKLMDAIQISIDVCRTPLKESGHIKDLVSELDELDRTIGKEDDEEFKSYLQSLRHDFKMNVIDRLLN